MLKPTLFAVLALMLVASPVFADEAPKPDDRITFDLAAEDWAMTKTARVTVNVEAAVSGASAGTMRADMLKAVEGMASGEWRLISFNRGQDQTGLERWSASFEARLPETALGSLADNAKKTSKAGLQLSVADVDFSPTLDETEAVKSNLRSEIYKKAAEQLTALNAALPGRGYRIADVNFEAGGAMPPMPRFMRANAAAATVSAPSPDSDALQRSEKIRVVAHVTMAAPATAAAEGKH